MPFFTSDQIDKTKPVLLVEDEAYVAMDIEQMLLDLGFLDVTIALTFDDATRQVAEANFGLAIFDINVGGMLSYGLISQAVAKGHPVLMISGYFVGAGTTDGRAFLAKSIDPKRLKSAIVDAYALCEKPNAA